jgi:hypothetical protein
MSSEDPNTEAIREGEPPYRAGSLRIMNSGRGTRVARWHYLVKHWRLLLALALFLSAALTFPAWWCIVRFSGPGVVNNELVGQLEDAIRSKYGVPVLDEVGYRGLGPNDPPPLPQGAIRSLTFRPGLLLHPKGGTLVVWLVQQNGAWVCFESCWFADDVKF